MENAEEIFHSLDDFSKRKPKTIPQELNEYLAYVARTGDPVYQWSLVKSLFKEKLLNVITDFYETTPGIVIPPYPNVDPFNYDIMKNSLLERLDSFTSAPFTVQRLCELLTFPRKQYNRVDKFMRAIEKNILVVSTREPGIQRHSSESENGEANEPIVNGSDNNSEYHVDVEMDDISRKENNEQWANEPQPGSSDTHISVDDIEARLKAKENAPIHTQDKKTTEYESVTPPELNVTTDDSAELKPVESTLKSESEVTNSDKEETSNEVVVTPLSTEEKDVEIKTECASTLVIPEIRVDDAEMTEQKLIEQATADKQAEVETDPETASMESKLPEATSESVQVCCDESSSDSKDESETKLISEVLTSSEESSSSSDNTDGSSSSPKTDEVHIDILEESNQSDTIVELPKTNQPNTKEPSPTKPNSSPGKIESEAYSISDVQSVLPTVAQEIKEKPVDSPKSEATEQNSIENVENSETEKK